MATFEPYIELWDLDLIDQPAPLAVLGGPSDPSLLGAKVRYARATLPFAHTRQRAPLAPDSHTAPVLGLAWNMVQRNLLASASADGKVKVWDLCTGQCVRTLAHHEGKVQAVAWHPSEASLLATGAFDQHIAVLDVRAPDAAVRVSVDADVETLMWMPGNRLLVATESGAVHCFDAASIRKSPKPMWSLQAHTKACHALCLSFNGHVLATGSAERTSPLKVWDLTHMPPLLLEDQTADVGAVLSLAFSPVRLTICLLHVIATGRSVCARGRREGRAAGRSRFASFQIHYRQVPRNHTGLFGGPREYIDCAKAQKCEEGQKEMTLVARCFDLGDRSRLLCSICVYY